MANLSTRDKQILESLFQMGSGYVLDFSNRTFEEFFRDDLGVDIYAPKYEYGSGSKANMMRGFWLEADDEMVGKSIIKLVEYIRTGLLIGNFSNDNFTEERLSAAIEIGERLLGNEVDMKDSLSPASFEKGNITIYLQDDIFNHVQKLLNDGHYYNAVEESYKIVREKLRNITGEEKATSAFSSSNFKKIFGHEARNEAEKDFFEGIKFLHMAIQFLRNEKSHTPAKEIDPNLALHYIVLASLAYDLISRNQQ